MPYPSTGPILSPDPPFTSDLDRVWDQALRFLECIVSVAAQEGVELPDRRLVTVGTPVADCEEVVVSLQNYGLGMPGSAVGGPMPCADLTPRYATYSATIIRCVPSGVGKNPIPEALDLTQFARVEAVDAAILMEAVRCADVEEVGVTATVTFTDPSGGYCGPVATSGFMV